MCISEINVLTYLQRVAILEVLIITMLEMIMFSLLPKVDHDRVASMSCLQKFVYNIEHMHERTCENAYVWSNGVGSQLRSRYVFKLLAITIN